MLGVLLMLSYPTLLWSYQHLQAARHNQRRWNHTNDSVLLPELSVSPPFQDEAKWIIINVAPGPSFVITRKCQRLNVEEAVVAAGWEQSSHSWGSPPDSTLVTCYTSSLYSFSFFSVFFVVWQQRYFFNEVIVRKTKKRKVYTKNAWTNQKLTELNRCVSYMVKPRRWSKRWCKEAQTRILRGNKPAEVWAERWEVLMLFIRHR